MRGVRPGVIGETHELVVGADIGALHLGASQDIEAGVRRSAQTTGIDLSGRTEDQRDADVVDGGLDRFGRQGSRQIGQTVVA